MPSMTRDASRAFNETIIAEFRANGGRVGGALASTPMILLHHRGARSGIERVTPLACHPLWLLAQGENWLDRPERSRSAGSARRESGGCCAREPWTGNTGAGLADAGRGVAAARGKRHPEIDQGAKRLDGVAGGHRPEGALGACGVGAVTSDYGRSSASLVVMNPRSGGGKVTRFRLVERAEALGARVLLTGPAQDPGSLARRGVEEGAEVLGAAGGDGTISAVAAVAADTGCPLVVIPAGTRNHFARDLGLDPSDPGVALHAVVDGQSVRVDLGRVGSRVFVNNVSFGMYADALLEPGYREAKGRTLAAVAPRYLDRRQAVPATVDIPGGAVDRPQLVLVSNNPYHLSTPRGFGRRPSLATGLLGGIVAKRPPGPPPPDLLQRLRRDLQGRGGPSDEGVITWSAASVTLAGTTPRLPVGIDGESVLLDLPVTCATWPGALRVLLPRG